MENNKRKDILNEKLDYFLESKIMTHVTLKGGRFLNARILKKINENVYEINELKIGLMHLFVSEIFRIEEFVKRGELQ